MLTESQIRALRCTIFGEIDDDSWQKVKEKWMTPANERWLSEQSKIPPFFPPGIYWKVVVASET